MARLKVMTILGTRPEIIRLSRVMAALDRATDHVVVHTGQNYDFELNQVFFDDLELRPPDHYLGAAGKTAAETIGQVIIAVDRVLAEVTPEAVLILGDTNSCLAAIPAKRRRIPVFHMEAGNRCFDMRVPEEINRRIVDHVADINLPYSAISRDYLLREGLPPDRVVTTGSPMFEVLHHFMPKIERSEVLTRLGLQPDGYFLVSCHREENVDAPRNFAGFVEILDNLARTFGKRVIVTTHPRTRKRIEGEGVGAGPAGRTAQAIRVHRLRGPRTARRGDAVGQRHDHRGGVDSEPARAQHPRRPRAPRGDGRRRGDDDRTQLGDGCSRGSTILASQPRGAVRALRLVRDYDVPNVSEKVVRIILSYTDYVRRVVWREPV